MKHAALASFLGAFALPGVLLAGGVPATVPSGLGVSGTDSSAPSFSWSAPNSGAEFHDLKVERFSGDTWSTFNTTSIAGDRTGHAFKDPGGGFPAGRYRAALRAKSTFWTGPWTTWTEFTIGAHPVTPHAPGTTEDIFPRLPATGTNSPGTSRIALRVRKYNSSRNPWTRSLKRTLKDGRAASDPMAQIRRIASRPPLLWPGVYRWDMDAREAHTEDGTPRESRATSCLDAARSRDRPMPDASSR